MLKFILFVICITILSSQYFHITGCSIHKTQEACDACCNWSNVSFACYTTCPENETCTIHETDCKRSIITTIILICCGCTLFCCGVFCIVCILLYSAAKKYKDQFPDRQTILFMFGCRKLPPDYVEL